jgi:glucose/arabinose dehydrogenase
MRQKRALLFAGLLATSVLAAAVTSGVAAGAVPALRVTLTPVVSGLSEPVAMSPRPDDTALYIAEQHTGLVQVVVGGVLSATPALDIGGTITQGGEQGLLGLAFNPDGSKLYVDYTDTAGDTQIDEYAMTASRTADVATRRNLLSVAQPFTNHNGGQLAFGPDGMLYIALGDGGSGGDPQRNAQNKASLLGKILRIDPTPNGVLQYSIPAGNPFVSDPAARPEIWHYGLRNPWRFSFDRSNGDLWTADVGQNLWEEVDYATAGTGGVNYGWNLREGRRPYNGGLQPKGAVNPILVYSHTPGGCAVIGGFRYRGAAIPGLVGKYVYSDFCLGKIMSFTPNATMKGGTSKWLHAQAGNPTSFGQDNAGELYVLAGDSLQQLTP